MLAVFMRQLKEDLFRVPLLRFGIEAQHAQKASIKGIGAAAILSKAVLLEVIGFSAVTILQNRKASLSYYVFSCFIDDYSSPVGKHGVYRMDEVLPVAVAEGILELGHRDCVLYVKKTALQADQVL